MRLFALVFLLFVAPLLLFSQTTTNYYVSDTGSDANAGTATAPFRTIQQCVDQFDDSTQVICNCSGTFNEEIEVLAGGPSPTHRSKIIAWDTDGDGSRSDETFIIDGQGIRNQALAAGIPERPDNIEVAWATFRNYEPDGGCNFDDDGGLYFISLNCWGSGGCADWWIHDNVFEKLGKFCGVESHYIAIQPSNAPNLIVESNRFDSIGGFIMRYVGGPGIKFRNNHVMIVGTGIKAWDNPDSIEIVGNVFECDGNGFNRFGHTGCGGQHAVNLSNNVTASQIKDNVFLDCETAINLSTDYRFGVKNNGPHLIEGNKIYQSSAVCNRYATAIQIADCSDTTIFGDSIRVFDVTLRNNIIAWTDSGVTSIGNAIKMTAGHPFPFENNIKLYNNTISGFGRGILMDVCYNSGTPFPHQLKNVDVYNNIFDDIKDELLTLGRNISSWPDSGRAMNWSSNHNVFSGRDRMTWGGTRYSFAQWVSSRGQDSNSIFGSPQFVADSNPAQPLFVLASADTIAQNNGTQQPDVLSDFTGLPRPMGDDWDIGAHEVRDKRIHFVDAVSGDNTNFGTKSKPFRSVQTALNQWDGTNQFELRAAGTFSEELTLAHGGPNADSMNLIAPWDTDNDGQINDETFVLDGGGLLAVALRTDSATSPDFVKINGVAFQNYAPSHCDSGTESRFLRLKGTQADPLVGWHVVGNSFDGLAKDCDPDGRQSSIYTRWVEDLVVEQNSFDSIGGFVLNSVRSQNIEFTENDVRLVGFGVKAGNGVDSITIAENVFVGDGNGANGVGGSECRREWSVELVNGVQYGLVSDNVFYGSSGGVLLKTNENGSRKNAHHVIEKNRVYLNDGACNPRRPGIFISDVSDVADGGDSIWVEDVLIRNNLLVFDGERDSSGAAIKLRSGHPYTYSNDIRVYNNTIVGFDQGMKVVGGKDDLGDAYSHQLRDVSVKNNLFSDIGDAQLKFENSVFGTSLPLGWESDYNVYGGVDRFRWKGGKALSKWQSKSGQDANSMLCDAEFASGDSIYHLSNTDVCAVESGTILPEVLEDIDGDSRPNGLLYDAGADERVTGTLARRAAGGGAGEAVKAGVLNIQPHPIQSSATISVLVEEEGVVSLRVYDARGRVVSGLLEEVSLDTGMHKIEWNRGLLPSGFYTVEVVRSGEEVERLKVVVVE